MNEEKAAFRKAIRGRYRTVDESALRKNDELIIHQILKQPLYQNAERVFLYVGINQEIYTMKLIEAAYQEGKTVGLPKSEPDGVMHFYRYTGALVNGRFHIPEPVSDELLTPRRNDLMIVPGLSFDRCGNRMGQGGGYYDRFLEKYNCATMGLCRDGMLAKKVPVSWNDLPVDFVITESTVFDCKKERSLM